MRIDCRHGYFKFIESKAGEAYDFMNLFDLELVPKGGFYTFAALADAPNFSIIGGEYLDAIAIATFEGQPSEVMRKNKLIYNFELDVIQPILSVTRALGAVNLTDNYFVLSGLILPGAVRADGLRATDYSAWFSREATRFKYSEVTYA